MESPRNLTETGNHPDEEDFLPEDGGYEYLHEHLNAGESSNGKASAEFETQEELLASHQKDHLPPLLQDENLNEYDRRDGNYYDDEDIDSLAGVNEADEAVNLADILAGRDSSLVEEELWALCRECCLVLEVVNCTPDMFQTLCITPDTVAFDNAGNVCFLDLGSDPEPLYLPPEFSDVTNNYKSHLYSLGMTLLYAAEYNVEPSRPEISPELRDLFGCMTSELLTSRPCLEDIITLCEEELVGKSSQEVCVDIASTFAQPTPTPPDLATVSLADVTASLANYLQSQSNLISTPGAEVTADTGVTETPLSGPQEHSTPVHLQVRTLEESTTPLTDQADDEDMPIRGVHTGGPMPTGNRGNRPTPAARKMSRSSDGSKDGSQQKPPVPKKPEVNQTVKNDMSDVCEPSNQSDHQKMLHGNNTSLERDGSKFKDSPLSGVANSSLEARHSSGAVDSQAKRPRKNKGLSLRDILETLERPLVEDEVWAVCREGTISLNKKRKHLPAYISPDTLLLRESGALSFKAIPEDKPLEVIYMAPEIQQKGQLSDKMCLFGMGVTMKFAIGNKYSMEASGVGDELQKLLAKMVEEDPDNRPSIEDVSEACGEHEGDLGIPSSSICQALYQEAFERVADKMAFAMPADPPKIQDPPEVSNGSAFRSIQGGSLIRPAAISSSSAAFKPIQDGKNQPGLPSQFMSSATHFKPIILQQSVTPAPEVKEVAKQQESPKDCQPNDKDKEVVKKLKELKKNLMQHRQPGKDKTESKLSRKSSKSPNVSPKVTNGTSKKPSEDTSEVLNKSSSDTKSETGGPLESLLSEIQKQGAVPDTQALASAIANFLQGQMAQSPNQNAPNVIQGQGQSPGQGQSQGQIPGQQNLFAMQGQTHTDSPSSNTAMPSVTPQQPNLTIPTQFQPSMVGQNLSVPLGSQQYSGGLMPGYPLQVQLQQDPRTGFIQLVPTGILPPPIIMGEDQPGSDNHSVHSARSPKPHVYSDNSSADNSAILNSSFNSNRSRGGRTARDLIQKTAGIRSRHSQGKASPLSIQPQGDYLWRSKSAHALDHLDPDEGTERQASQRMSLAPGHVYDDSVLNTNRQEPKRSVNTDFYSQSSKKSSSRPRTIVGYPETGPGRGGQYFTQPPRTRSQSSSPSPSKDSGVSGMNTGYKPPPPGSLMERLLSNVNVQQQQKLGQVVHLLREEFAFDGYMENGVEDIAMAEYITSLGNLKLDTFASAVTEKYSDLYWGSDLLFNLYDAANGLKGSRRLKSSAKSYHQNHVSKQQSPSSQLPIPGLDDPDRNMSSSSPSESGLPQTPQKQALDATYQNVPRHTDKSKNRHMPTQQKMQHHNTSDSSDTEQYDRRRRYRRKHNTDKSRNSQDYNLRSSGYDTPSMELHPLRKDTDISPRLQMHMTNGENPLLQNGNIQVPQIRDWEPEKTSHANNPNSLIQDDEKISDREPEKPPPPQGRQIAWVTSPDKRDDLTSTRMSLDRRRRPTPDSSLTPSTRQVSASNNVLSADMSKLKRRVTPEKPPRHSLVHSNRVEGHIQPGPRPLKAIHRDGSTSSHSSEVTAEPLPVTNLSRNMSQLSLDNNPIDTRLRNRKGHVVFHSAMMELFSSPELDKFRQEIDEDDPAGLQSRLNSIQQQLMMERKMKRKSQTFYTKLSESPKAKGEQKNRIVQVSKDLEDMTQKVRYLELCKTHVEMLQAELSGIHSSYLHSLATCPKGQPLHLRPCQDSSFLQFQHPKEPHSGYEILSLQSGTSEGLMSYLFANTALRDGYTHQFMYCFRYLVRPVKLLSFLVNSYKAAAEASGQGSDGNMSKIRQRVMDLIYYWLEGYYSVDFDRNNEATELLRAFLQLSDIAALPEGKDLKELLSNCEDGFNIDLVSAREEEDIHIYKANTPRKVYYMKEDIPRQEEWGSLKNILGRGKSSSPKLTLFHEKRTPVTKLATDDGFLPTKSPRRVDAFTLLDHTPQTLAEQLTLMAQNIFQLTHPVHYLNSKAQGISVAMTMTGSKTPLMQRMTGQDSDQPLPPSLFVNKTLRETAVQLMIEHDQEVGHWVAAEIVNCSNPKNQLAILTKFLQTAQICKDMRNYGTCLAILDGLENLIVKQLPAWRNLQGKCVTIMEELSSVRLFLKNDGMAITSVTNSHLLPTIPSVLLFLFHVQQQEFGSFQLANGMYKWSKIRSISKIIDQIRIFKHHLYGFEPDFDLQDDLQLRIREFGGQDIHQIAAQHHTNYQKMPSGGISGAIRKMKGKLQSK